MKSGKQRRAELDAKKQKRRDETAAEETRRHLARQARELSHHVVVDGTKLAPYGSYGGPLFVTRGYYLDQPFVCQGCGKEEVWTARQQKWWYEVAKGSVWTTARFCRACRRRERERRADARRVHLDGLEKKRKNTPPAPADGTGASAP